MEKGIIPAEYIENHIYLIRGHKVMLDSDLARLYGVEVKRLSEQVSRNQERFPQDFCFQLSQNEAVSLRSRIATSKNGRGGRRYLPRVFTEQGVAMLSSVLRSKSAVQANIAIMRAFVKLRRILASNTELFKKLEKLEKRYDAQFKVVFKAIHQLMSQESVPPKRQIGFIADRLFSREIQ